MKKYSKKVALILVLALTLAVAIPVLAAGEKTEINGAYAEPVLAVSLPADTSAVINPYGLPVSIKTDSNVEIADKMMDSQIVAAKPLFGYSTCEVDLDIGATVVGVPSSSFRLSTEKPESDSTLKTGLVYFEMKTVDDLAYTTTPDTTCIGSVKGEKVVQALNAWAKKAYSESNTDQVIVSARPTTKNGMCTLEKGVKQVDGSYKPATNGYFVARLTGDLVKAPTDPWKETDTLDVTITWIIEPSEP